MIGRARQRLLSLPRVVLVVAAIGTLNGAGWALLTPAFQVPDETAHFAYVQSLVERGERPGAAGRPELSTEQAQTMEALRTGAVIGRVNERGPATRDGDAKADRAIDEARRDAPRGDGGGPSTASGQPSLYYALAAIPYKLTSWASVPTRVTAIRLFGAGLLGVTAALVALLALEFVPRREWAALVAGAAVGLQPVVGFISGGVTPDPLLMALSTAVLLSLVRAWRLGLTMRRAAVVGGLLGAGAVTKLTFLALLPPAVLALIILAFRDRIPQLKRAEAASLRTELRLLGAAVGSALILPALFVLWTKLQGMPIRPPGTAPSVLDVAEQRVGAAREELSYIWQLYLPKVPGQFDQFSFDPVTETWVKGLVGRYGWLDYSAPDWMVTFATWLLRLGLLLVAAVAIRYRRALRKRLPEVLTAAALVASLLVVIGHEGYGFRNSTGLVFEQARYVFPAIGVYGLAVVATCLAFGQRHAPAVAGAWVGLFVAHDLSGVMLTVSRYYGG